jgi:hypothetical protein
MAATNYILVTGQVIGRLNSQCRIYIDLLKQVRNAGDELKDAMAQAAADGSPAFETDMGLSAEDAAAVQAVLASAATDIAASNAVAQAISRFC